MHRSHLLIGSLLLVAACSTPPVPQVEPFEGGSMDVVAPAPLGETAALPGSAVDVPGVSQAWGGATLSYGRTQSVDHEWSVAGVGRMQVSFELSFSAPAGWEDIAATCLLVRWDEGKKIARRVCEGSDLTTMEGLDRCSERLGRELTRALFDDGGGEPTGRIERVIWNSVRWH